MLPLPDGSRHRMLRSDFSQISVELGNLCIEPDGQLTACLKYNGYIELKDFNGSGEKYLAQFDDGILNRVIHLGPNG